MLSETQEHCSFYKHNQVLILVVVEYALWAFVNKQTGEVFKS